MEKDIQILLVDDHQVVRDGLQHMLSQEEDMEVIGQSASAEEALSQVETLSPSIVLMDIKMPGVNGIELTRQLLEKQPSGKVIMLTLYDEYLAEAMEAGAVGYLLKDIKRAQLAQAIRQVHHGKVVISESIPSKSREEYEERFGKKVEEHLLQEEGEPESMLEEVQLIIPPPAEVNQLIRFVSRVEEMLRSRILQMVGSWNGGTAITIPLTKPIPLADIVNALAEMPEVGVAGEEPLIEELAPDLLKKAGTIRRPQNRNRKTIFVTLEKDQT